MKISSSLEPAPTGAASDVQARAVALRDLVERQDHETSSEPFVEALITCCRELLNADRHDIALSLLDAVSTREPMADVTAFRLGVIRVRALMLKGVHAEAHALATSLLARYPTFIPGHEPDWYELRISEPWSLWQTNRAGEAVQKLLVIREELLRAPDSYALALCTLQLSGAELTLGRLSLSRRYALEALVSSRRCGNRFVEGIATANLGRVERAHCRWATAEDAATEALRLFEECGNRKEMSVARRMVAILKWKRGKLVEAAGVAADCVDESRRLGSAIHEWFSCLLMGMVSLHMGRFAEAGLLFTSRPGWELPRAESRPSLLTTEFLGDIYLEQGQAEQALKYYDEVWPKALSLVPKGDIVAELRRRRAECYLLLGRLEEAYQEALIGLNHCRDLGDRYEEAATYRVLAMAAAEQGTPEEAKRWFDQGFAYYDDIETPYEWGKLWMAYGDWLNAPRSAGYSDARGALEAYHAARDHFERMGAAAKLAEADARIAVIAPARAAASLSSNAIVADARRDRPRRRPRGFAEADRRSSWARETFGIVTRNKGMLDLLDDVAKLAGAGSSILVLGESGTGKELIAQGVHRLSRRAGAFIPIDCAALPRDVIESELFGHVQGAFTGASREKAGLFEVCDGGTVFLDEIAEMSIELQSRLLRFLETGEIRRVGANRTIAVNTLVVAATNRDRAALERGDGFRPDLYYRLAHAVVVLPPLRRRGDDLDVLVTHFFAEACREQGKQVTLSAAARQRLLSHPWPGNVRQLRAVLRRMAILAAPDHEIAAAEIHLDDAGVASTLSEELEQAERRKMVEALAQARGSRSDAARALGMARTTLVTKMKRYGIR